MHSIKSLLILVASAWGAGAMPQEAVHTAWNLFSESVPASEYNALQDLYVATHGHNWIWRNNTQANGVQWNFTEPSNPCTQRWQGINCTLSTEDQYNHIRAVQLSGYNLIGTIPNSIASLTYLQELDLGTNDIVRGIPAPLCSITSLERLLLDNNQFTGSVPSCLNQLSSLELIDFSKNLLHGTLPATFGSLSSLLSLDLGHNRLSGGIPSVLSSLTQLQTLRLDANKFTGPVTTAFMHLQALQVLSLSNNRLSGSIPSYFGSLANLQDLEMYFSGMHGQIPRSLGSLARLETLNLEYNRLTGTVPDTFANLKALKFFDVGYNLINGSIPTFWSSLPNLSELWLLDNQFSGTVPPELGDIANIQTLRIESNLLHGTVPSSLGRLTQLENVVLFRNFITGVVPPAFSNISSLQYIDMGDNYFEGPIPESLTRLPLLQYLFLDTNRITGTIPYSVGEMSQMRELILYNNMLTGSLPKSIADLSRIALFLVSHNLLTGPINGIFDPSRQKQLNTIQMNNNQFSGVFPKEIFHLESLQALIAGSNCFTSFAPSEVCYARSLVSLSLDGLTSSAYCAMKILPGLSPAYSSLGKATTQLAPCLFGLPYLKTLHLSGTGLTGRLPQVENITTELIDLGLSHNALAGTIPTVYQHKFWASFDLSYNRFSGTLDNDFTTHAHVAVANLRSWNVTEVQMSIDNNRLSGKIPESLIHLSNVSILGSNLFTCNHERSNLPNGDDGKDKYDCASDTFNEPYFVWLAVCFCVAAGLAATAYYFGRDVRSIMTWQIVHQAQVWLRAASGALPNGAHADRLKTLVLVSRICDALCLTAVYILAFIVLFAMPLYIYMSQDYGTMTHQYAYIVSMAFLSGKVPAALEILVLVALMIIVLALFLGHVITLRRKEIAIRSNARIVKRMNTRSVNEAEPEPSHFKIWSNNTALYTLYIVVNLTIVIGANAAYVYVVIYADSRLRVLAQILLAVFKIAWNSLGSASIVRWINSKIETAQNVRTQASAEETRMIMFQILVTLINNIAIPCVVGAVVSPSCFYYVVEPAPNVSSIYQYALCLLVIDGECAGSIPVPTWTVYQPSFNYSYQCSSSIVQYYAPAYMAVSILATFVVPVGQCLLCYWHQRADKQGLWFKFLDVILPNILQPIPSASIDVTTVAFKGFFQANLLLILIVNYVGILLTFGAVFPPLAVALTFALLSVAHFIKLKLGRFLCTAVKEDRLEYIDLVETECQRAGAVEVLRRSVLLLLFFCSIFFTLFVFDTLGDAVGFHQAYWVLIVLPSLPFVIAFTVRVIRYYRPELLEMASAEEGKIEGDVEMNDALTFNHSGGTKHHRNSPEDGEQASTLNALHE